MVMSTSETIQGALLCRLQYVKHNFYFPLFHMAYGTTARALTVLTRDCLPFDRRQYPHTTTLQLRSR
ncbi:hypothetical protein VTI74DRAFT_4233 [Chaetomium olivicolor]